MQHKTLNLVSFITVILGNVPIIVYGCSFRRDSLFQDVLKRPGTFKNVIKFSKIGQIWPGKNIQVENSLLEAELPIHGVAMRRAFKRYRRTVPAWTSAEVVRLLPCVHCVYTVYTLCVHWHASVNRIFTGLFLPVLPVTARTSQRHESSCSKSDDFFTDRSIRGQFRHSNCANVLAAK